MKFNSQSDTMVPVVSISEYPLRQF